MRTGPFSSPAVIERINAHFVPVYAVNEDYRKGGCASPAERAEKERIYRETLGKGMSAGTVHVYALDAKGTVVGSLHVAEAAHEKKLLALLDKVIRDTGVTPGKTLVTPKPQSAAPDHEAGSLVLHLVARPVQAGVSWDGTSENWIVYTPEEARQWLPAGKPEVGHTHTVPPELSARLLTHFYPVTENNDPEKNELREQSLRVKVLDVKGGVVRCQVEGKLRMRHDFYHKPDGKEVVAGVVGALECEAATGRVRSLRLVSDDARYAGRLFGVAVRSEP